MDEGKGQFAVFFEEPFWVGVFEEITDGSLSVCKVTFGKEPTEEELWAFVLRNYHKLRFSPSVRVEVKQEKKLKNNGNMLLKHRSERISIGGSNSPFFLI